LGEFLFRAARVRDFREADPQRGHYYQTTNRPYPGGGAVYELELYPVINNCAGIEPGLYHYDPFAHELVRLSGPTQDTERLIDEAYEASGLEHDLEVLIVIAARFQRFSWKYASVAYSVILKNVGVLLQNMYLVATAMGLAPCALGGGDSDLFAQAAGINYLAEASVGEFILGKPA
jgi:SagB-type dehydrogenase family enzyme